MEQLLILSYQLSYLAISEVLCDMPQESLGLPLQVTPRLFLWFALERYGKLGRQERSRSGTCSPCASYHGALAPTGI